MLQGELYIPAGGSLDRDNININQAPNCRAIYRYRIEGRDQGNTPLSCYSDVRVIRVLSCVYCGYDR